MWSRLLPLRLAVPAAKVPKCNYMEGPGGRKVQNRRPKSLSVAGLRRHWDLIPLFTVITVAMSCVGIYVVRLATKATDISWRSHDPHASDAYISKPFKLISTHPPEQDVTVMP